MRNYKIALKLLLIITIITGVIYPVLVTLISQILFPFEANGSLIVKNKKIIGSELIGQLFDDPKYFFGRPSATLHTSYDAMFSSGSNLGPHNPARLLNLKKRVYILKKYNLNNQAIPIELVTTSASGLDPHISPQAALYQISRIAKIRRLSENTIKNLIIKFMEYPQFGFLGEARINVLKLNIALDEINKS